MKDTNASIVCLLLIRNKIFIKIWYEICCGVPSHLFGSIITRRFSERFFYQQTLKGVFNGWTLTALYTTLAVQIQHPL